MKKTSSPILNSNGDSIVQPTISPDSEAIGVTADSFTKNQVIRLQSFSSLDVSFTPNSINDPNAPKIRIPGGSVIRIIQIDPEGFLLLQMCSVGEQVPADLSVKILAKGNRGWIQLLQLKSKVDFDFTATYDFISLCQ